MIEKLKNLSWKQFGGLVLIVIIIIAFGFGGFGSGFSTNNQNNIAKINKTNVTTQDFMDYVNQSGISADAIRNNLDNNVIEELLSGLISTTLINLEIEDFNISINEKTILKNIKENKNFHDENGKFERVKYEKFLLENNQSAPQFELRLKNRELQKNLFSFVGAGTVSPKFLVKKLKREYIDFRYVILNPKNLIGIEEFNQDFFDEIDEIENKISQGSNFENILENINVNIIDISKFVPSSSEQINEELIYSKKETKLDLIESGDNFLLYNIDQRNSK